MEPMFVMLLTGFCALFGAILMSLPARRYYINIRNTAFGVALLFSGVILSTTFKWTDVAMKIGQWEVKIAQQERALSTVGDLVRSAELDLIKYRSEISDRIELAKIELSRSGQINDETIPGTSLSNQENINRNSVKAGINGKSTVKSIIKDGQVADGATTKIFGVKIAGVVPIELRTSSPDMKFDTALVEENISNKRELVEQNVSHLIMINKKLGYMLDEIQRAKRVAAQNMLRR
ncbi:hypothetical protein [Jiella sonneratiae]|uniref:Uncharacterized protein n=1 Tax=Jiella sonneratiae TaxID=2816856 RepID=A0ABS3J3P3_9HYPH|nr:hypothetical protein [Jiella sonneratiae]MBO0904295.1 hypothetical protein [Jiella sonneratiae]